MEATPDLTVIDGEAPESPAEATNTPEGIPVPSMDELARQVRLKAQQKGMTGGERLMVLDGWVMDTLAVYADLIAHLQAQVVDLMRMLATMIGNRELLEGLPDIDPEQQTRSIVNSMAMSRLQAEIDYLDSKPGPEGPRLIVPTSSVPATPPA